MIAVAELVKNYAERLGLPNEALEWALEALERKGDRLRWLEGSPKDKALALLALACRATGACTIWDVLLASDAAEDKARYRAVTRLERILLHELGVKPVNPEAWLGYILEKLPLHDHERQEIAREALKTLSAWRRDPARLAVIQSSSPRSVAALAVHLASRRLGIPLRKVDVARAAGISTPSLIGYLARKLGVEP